MSWFSLLLMELVLASMKKSWRAAAIHGSGNLLKEENRKIRRCLRILHHPKISIAMLFVPMKLF